MGKPRSFDFKKKNLFAEVGGGDKVDLYTGRIEGQSFYYLWYVEKQVSIFTSI